MDLGQVVRQRAGHWYGSALLKEDHEGKGILAAGTSKPIQNSGEYPRGKGNEGAVPCDLDWPYLQLQKVNECPRILQIPQVDLIHISHWGGEIILLLMLI